MPTTQEEAAHITRISLEYMTPDTACTLYTRLDEEVGKFTDNDSLKKSLAMMRQLMTHVAAQHAAKKELETLGLSQIDPPPLKPIIEHVFKDPIPPSKLLWANFYALVVVHLALVLGIVTSFFVLPFRQPLEVALPLMVFIFFYSTNKIECPLTNWENRLRKKLGMKVIGGFVGHYFKRPIYRALTAVGLKAARRIA